LANVELRGVSKTYSGGVEALAGIDLAVADGEYLTIVGPSGSGKSTLLRVVAGLEAPDSGTLWIGGRQAGRLAPSARDVAMVFQDHAAYPHLSVFENLAFGLRARGRPQADVRARVEEAAALLGLSTVLGRMPKALSGGQRQRVALGRALARRPAILLLDEPLSGLDAPLRASTRADLSELHRRLGTTTLHVTHDQGEALSLGDRVAVLDHGRLVQVGSPREVYDRPATRFVAEFLGSPPMNILPVALTLDDSSLRIDLVGVEPEASLVAPRDTPWAAPLAHLAPGPVLIGLRPEHIAPAEPRPDPSRLTVSGLIRRVEPLGHETLATLALDDNLTLALRLPAHDPIRRDDTRTVALDPARATWFDPRTGGRI
jgi:ABC-type sugar transport system ATPase subunit